MTLLMLSGNIDLSVGSNMALVGTVIILFQKYGITVSIIAGLIIGTLIGLINGILVTKLKIEALPATLGMMTALRGVVLLLTKTQTIKGENQSFMLLGNSSFYTIPYAVIIFVFLLIVSIILMSKSYFGRNIYAIGGNPIASRFFGINVEKLTLISFTITGFLVGVAGVIITSRLNVASGIIGVDTALIAITAVLLGGTSLMGGEGGPFKSFQGILLLGIIANAMRMLNISPSYQILINGLILIVIVSIDGNNIKNKKFS
jgi:ribose transport system permease protein